MILLLACAVLISIGSAQRRPKECESLGFQVDAVNCAHCSILLLHTNEPELYDECKSCCTDMPSSAGAEADKVVQYSRARLELDFRSLNAGSEIARFVNDHADTFANLRVVEVPRVFPRLILVPEDGSAPETIRVHTWPADMIVEFLKKKLVA